MIFNKKSFSALVTLGAATAAAGGWTQAAVAQDESLALEEVVVTARKREESLQDIPMSVTATTSEDIVNRGLQSLDDVARFAPGLSFSKAFGRATERPVIRGLGNVLAGVQFGVEAGAAYFIDGIYYPGDVQGLDLGNLDRVEVIKGPQSALYGRNTYSGAINFITKPPGDDFAGEVKVNFAEDGEQDLRASVSGPLIEGVLRGRLGLRTYEFDGQWENQVTQKDVGDESTDSITGVLDWQATDSLHFALRGVYQQDDDGTRAFFLQPATANNCFPGERSLASWPASLSGNNNQYFCGEIKPRPVALNDNDDADGVPTAVDGVPIASIFQDGTAATFFGNPYALTDGTAFDGVDRDMKLVSLGADYQFANDYVLTLATAYRDEVLKTGSDSDHGSLNFKFAPPAFDATEESFFALSSVNDTEDYSVELRLESPTENAFSWLVGAFYYKQDKDVKDITFVNSSGILDSVEEIEDQAVFASVSYDFTDRLTATLEARYQEETKSVLDLEVDVETNSSTTIGAFDEEDTWYAFTPRLSVDYQLSDDVLLYAVYSEGNKPGGFNGNEGADAGLPQYLQEESKNYELGVKSKLWNDRLRANLALFFMEVDDVQLTTAVPNPSGALNSIVTNQGSGEVTGLELDIRALLSEYVIAGFNYALADTEFTEGCDEFQWTLTSGGGAFDGSEATSPNFTGNGDCSIEGNQFPLSSKHMASLFVDFSVPVSDGGMEFFAGADATYESKKYVQVHNLAYSPEATVVGARLGLRGERWQVTAYGRNLTDEDAVPMTTRWLALPYLTFASLNTAADGSDTGSPRAFFGALRRERQFGIDLRYSF